MSLINDALRRAKQAQQGASPTPTPDTQFRTIEPPTHALRHGVGLLLPALLAAVALLSLLLFWELSHQSPASAKGDPGTPLTVAARTLPTSAVSSPAEPPVQASDNSVPNPTSAIKPGPETVPATDNPSPTNTAVSARTNIPALNNPGATNHAPVRETEPPALKLQGIVFNPRRPSALINGRVFFVGERVREYRIMAIHQDDVLLVGAGRTNLLSLDP